MKTRAIFIDIDTKQKIFNSDNEVYDVPRRGDFLRHHEELYDKNGQPTGIFTKWYRIVMVVNSYRTVLGGKCPERYALIYVSSESSASENQLEYTTGLESGEDPYDKYIREEY